MAGCILIQYQTDAEAKAVFKCLSKRKDHQLLPKVSYDVNRGNMVRVGKYGTRLDHILDQEIEAQRNAGQQRRSRIFMDTFFFEHIFEEKRNRFVTVGPSMFYAKMIRDLVTVIDVLKDSVIYPTFGTNRVFLHFGDKGGRICARTTSFRLKTKRPAEGNEAFDSLINFLSGINEGLHISGSARKEFDNFFGYLRENPRAKLSDLLTHPLFWPRHVRMRFYNALDDVLRCHSGSIIEDEYSVEAFPSIGGEDWRLFFKAIDNNPDLEVIHRGHYDFLVEDTGSTRLYKSCIDGKEPADVNGRIKLCLEILRDIHEHFYDIRSDVACSSLKIKTVEQLQRVFQNLFPDHITNLVPAARRLNAISPSEIGQILESYYFDYDNIFM